MSELYYSSEPCKDIYIFFFCLLLWSSSWQQKHFIRRFLTSLIEALLEWHALKYPTQWTWTGSIWFRYRHTFTHTPKQTHTHTHGCYDHVHQAPLTVWLLPNCAAAQHFPLSGDRLDPWVPMGCLTGLLPATHSFTDFKTTSSWLSWHT